MKQSSLLRKTILNRPRGEYSSDTCKLAQKNKETKTTTTILVSPCPPPPKKKQNVLEAARMSEWEGPMGESWFLSLASSVNVSHHFNFLVCKMVKIATLWLGGVKRRYANKGTLRMSGCPPHVTICWLCKLVVVSANICFSWGYLYVILIISSELCWGLKWFQQHLNELLLTLDPWERWVEFLLSFIELFCLALSLSSNLCDSRNWFPLPIIIIKTATTVTITTAIYAHTLCARLVKTFSWHLTPVLQRRWYNPHLYTREQT